ncbi:hypothetical protein ACIA8G_09580 [Lentzea sp. NPDC051213]|uniref:hypothetical protein n=1 Tax=Lentzea sp. NPDC051213 TaxID=3364126 RepID=UPI0037B85C91
MIEHAEAIVPAGVARLQVKLARTWLAAGAWREAQVYAQRAQWWDKGSSEPPELLAAIRGYTVVLLGRLDDGRAELAPQLQVAFGKAPYEVVNRENPISEMISSPHRVDCAVAVVAADVGVTAELRDQFAVALAIGASIGIALTRISHAVREVELDLGPDFPDVPVVRAGSGDEIYELADRIPGWIKSQGAETECTQFRALLMTPEDHSPPSTMIDFGEHRRTASVLAELPGAAEDTVLVLFEVSEAVSVMAGARFVCELGSGVVTRIVK